MCTEVFFTLLWDLHKLSFYGNMQNILCINVEACSDNQAIKMHIHC